MANNILFVLKLIIGAMVVNAGFFVGAVAIGYKTTFTCSQYTLFAYSVCSIIGGLYLLLGDKSHEK